LVVLGLIMGLLWMRRASDQPRPESTLASELVELGLSLGAPEGSADPEGPIFINLGLASPRVINVLAHSGQDALDDLPELTIGTSDSPWWSGIQLVARQGEDEQVLSWTRLSGEAQPVADLSDGLGRSIRVVVKPGGVRLRGPLRLQARMRWNEQVLDSNEVDLDVSPKSLNTITMATLFTNYFLETGQLDEAQASMEELVRLQPKSSNTYALRARVLEEAGDLSAAQKSWLRAIELLPQDMEAPATIYFGRLRAVEERLAAETPVRSP
jgi:tetratricopeptide (TPR) repeat protein